MHYGETLLLNSEQANHPQLGVLEEHPQRDAQGWATFERSKNKQKSSIKQEVTNHSPRLPSLLCLWLSTETEPLLAPSREQLLWLIPAQSKAARMPAGSGDRGATHQGWAETKAPTRCREGQLWEGTPDPGWTQTCSDSSVISVTMASQGLTSNRNNLITNRKWLISQ